MAVPGKLFPGPSAYFEAARHAASALELNSADKNPLDKGVSRRPLRTTLMIVAEIGIRRSGLCSAERLEWTRAAWGTARSKCGRGCRYRADLHALPNVWALEKQFSVPLANWKTYTKSSKNLTSPWRIGHGDGDLPALRWLDLDTVVTLNAQLPLLLCTVQQLKKNHNLWPSH